MNIFRISLVPLLGHLALIVFFLGQPPLSLASAETKIIFSPEGYSKRVTQVRAKFPTPVAPLGQLSTPFRIECPAEGQGRWVTTTDWVYDFKEAVPAGTSCLFELTLKNDLSGKTLASQTFRFDTGGPQIFSIDPYPDYPIDEDQLFTLELDSPVKEESLKGKLYFVVPQIASPIPVKILSLAEVKKANPDYAKRYENSRTFPLFLQATQRFPSAKSIELIWLPGIESKTGAKSVQKQSYSFKTREPFRAKETCPRASRSADCSPLDDIDIRFTAPPDKDAKLVIEGLSPEQKLEKKEQDWIIPAPHAPGAVYKLKYDTNFRDDAGRTLEGDRERTLKIGRFPPLVKFQGKLGILEWKGDPRLPIHLRKVEADIKARVLRLPLPVGPRANITEFLSWIKRNEEHDSAKALLPNGTKGLELRDVPGYVGKDKFEVRGLPLSEPGFYQVEVSSAELGRALDKKPMHIATQALVTDLVIHWKETGENQLAWVTSLASGLPVAGADISIFNCQLKKVGQGKTNSDGIIFIQEKPKTLNSCAKDWTHWDSRGLLITAQKAEDFTFVFNHQDRGIEDWRFDLRGGDRYANPQIHTVFDRTLLLAGETLSGLAIARKRTLKGFDFVKPQSLPKAIIFTHAGSGKEFRTNLNWDQANRASFQWSIPKEAALGTYNYTIDDLDSGTITVGEFKTANSRAELNFDAKEWIAPKDVGLHFNLAYLNGGSAGESPISLKARLRPSPFQSETYPDYAFNRKSDRGEESGAQGIEEVHDDEGEGESEESKVDKDALPTVKTKLDRMGNGKTSLKIPAITERKTLDVVMEFPDANGQRRTIQKETTLWASDLMIGLKTNNSTRLKPRDRYALEGRVLDLEEKAAEAKVSVTRVKKDYLSHRRRSIGGTYTYEFKTVLSGETKVCEKSTDAQGIFRCDMTFPESGNYILRAETLDKSKRKIMTEIDVWVEGKQRWYDADDHDRIDLVPDKKIYEPGDKARLWVKAPFAEGQMLIATEREGLISYAVKAFDGKNPYIDIPIAREFAPNIYVSVWLVRGRSRGTEPFLEVDLGKPAYKLGIVDLKVGRKAHELKVSVTADQKVYPPQGKSKVRIEVSPPPGMTLGKDAAVTLIAVDEGLLQLADNASWNLLEGMLGHRAYTGKNATASMMVVGKRHYGLKALPPGGSGDMRKAMFGLGGLGTLDLRSSFESLLKWTALVPLAEGKAEVEIPLNDSLSSFRIVAVAHAGADTFGTGWTNISTQRDLSLYSGLPALVRNGDNYLARFTLRNASDKTLEVNVTGEVEQHFPLEAKKVRIEGGSTLTLDWTIKVPEGVKELNYKIAATSGNLSDSLAITQAVVDPIPEQTLIADILPLATSQEIPLERPKDAGSSSIHVRSQSSLGQESLTAMKEYMEAYPHQCLEQRYSRAIALGDKKLWDKVDIKNYIDSQGLVKFFPSLDHGSIELTAYLLELSAYSGWSLPDTQKYPMISALQRFVRGDLPAREKGSYLVSKLRAMAALSLHESLESGKEEIDELKLDPTYLTLPSLVDFRRILQSFEGRSMTEVDKALAARSEYRGTILQWKTDERTLLGSTDATLARIILSRLKSKEKMEDAPELIRSLTASQNRGQWDTTVANALSTLALKRFAEIFEKTKIEGEIEANIGTEKTLLKIDQAEMKLAWPEGRSTLELLKGKSQGSPWVTVRARARLPIKEAQYAGFQLSKTIKKIEGDAKGPHRIGDIYEVTVRYQTRVDQNWVSLVDSIPSGSRILPDTYQATYTEQGFEGIKAYFEFVSPGEYTFKYRFQLNTSGEFILPPTRIEAMYAPEAFALLPSDVWKIEAP